MKSYLLSLILFFNFVFSGCAVGPLVSHDNARTVGKSNSEFMGGVGSAGYLVKWNYGLSENLDFAVQFESLSLGIRAKYSFLNNKEGFSFATALGTGASIGGSHYYADIIGSFLNGSWEPYGLLRVVQVKTDPLELKDEDTGELAFTVDEVEYSYGQAILGTRYWFNKSWFLSLEVSSLFSISNVKFTDEVLVGTALGYKF
jgi:hypothetical protein